MNNLLLKACIIVLNVWQESIVLITNISVLFQSEICENIKWKMTGEIKLYVAIAISIKMAEYTKSNF